MKKASLVLALLVLPVLFLACGGGEAPVEDANEPVIEEEVVRNGTITINNELGGWDLWYCYASSAEDGEWGEDRFGSEIIEDGDSFSFDVPIGTYDIKVIDVDDDEYILRDVSVGADGFVWDVVLDDMDNSAINDFGDATITINNELGSWDLFYCYASSTEDGDWGEDRFGSEIISADESFTFNVPAGDYDIKVIDDEDDEYVLWDVYVGADGFVWDVELSDMDNSERDNVPENGAPITFYNGLGDWSILYAYGDLSNEPWGEDRLGSEILEPGEELTFYVPAGYSYDLKVEDVDGDTYTLWGVDVDEDGYYWEIELSDMDD